MSTAGGNVLSYLMLQYTADCTVSNCTILSIYFALIAHGSGQHGMAQVLFSGMLA